MKMEYAGNAHGDMRPQWCIHLAGGVRKRSAKPLFHFPLSSKYLQLMSLLAYLCFNNLVDTSRYFCNTYISMANNWCFRRILSGGKQVVVMSVSRVFRLPEEICGPRYKGSTLLPGLAKPKRVHLMKVPVIQLWWRISYVILDESTKHIFKKNILAFVAITWFVFTCIIVSCLFNPLSHRWRYYILSYFLCYCRKGAGQELKDWRNDSPKAMGRCAKKMVLWWS